MLPPKVNNQWRIILTAVAFNMLFEYSLRGINNLPVLPILPFILLLFYLTYYTMLEDLIARYKLKDYNLLLLTFAVGLFYGMFISGDTFHKPQIFGVNFSNVLYGNFIWFGLVQGIMTFYIANRLTPRDWSHKKLSRKGWSIAILLNAFMVILFQSSGKIPKGTPIGYLTISIMILLISLIFWKTFVPKAGQNITPKFEKSTFFDFLSILTLGIFLVCAVIFIHDPIMVGASTVNATSLKIIIAWTTILAILSLTYRLASKKIIPI